MQMTRFKRGIFQAVMLAVGMLALLTPDLSATGGTVLAYTVLTNSEVNALWRKAQGKLHMGFNFVSQEFKWCQQFRDLEVGPSLREMTFPTQLIEDRGVTSLPEGGREARPMSVNAVDATVTFIHLNSRFTVSKLARWALGKDEAKAAIKNQLKHQGMTKVQALGRVASDMFYGFSTNYLFQVDDAGASLGAATSHTIPIQNGFGSTAITDAAFICDKVKVGDWVALIRSGSLVTNAIGEVTAVTPGTPSIAVTWNGSVDPADDDYVVFANGTDATTIAHTSYNRGLTGLLDMMTAASLHGIATSAQPNWAVSYSDATAGRYNGVKFRRACDEIKNYGHDEAKITTLMAQGVHRDLTAQYMAGVRYDDTMSLEIDGDPKGKGKKFKSTRRVPPGHVFHFDQSRALYKKSIHDHPEKAPRWGDGKELIDDSGMIFAIDTALLIATDNRKLMAYFQNQTEL